MGKCLDCPTSFQSIYNYPSVATPLSTIYNPYHCYLVGYTLSVPTSNYWATAYNYCLGLAAGSSLLRIENSLYAYDQSVANFLVDGRFWCLWLDSQALNDPPPVTKYYYSDGFPVPGGPPYSLWGGPSPSTESVILYKTNQYYYYTSLNDGYCNTICQYGV